MKKIAQILGGLSAVIAMESTFAQDLQVPGSKPINDFYVFTEGGAAYMPNVGFKDATFISGSILGNNFSLGWSDFNLSTNLGYNVTAGFGYSFNKNISLELEAGFIQNTIPSYSANLDATWNGTSGSLNGVTVPVSGAYFQQIPICVNFVVCNPDLQVRPMVGIGLGFAPTKMELGTYTADFTAIGGDTVSLDLGSYTANPFLIKLKAGLGYSVNPNMDIGIRFFANILTGSDFGSGLKTDVYGVVGANANLTVRF